MLSKRSSRIGRDLEKRRDKAAMMEQVKVLVEQAYEPTDPFERFRLSCVRQAIYVVLSEMVSRRKKQTVAYYGVKLAQHFITPGEHVAFLAGLHRSGFFERVATRVAIGCSSDSDYEF